MVALCLKITQELVQGKAFLIEVMRSRKPGDDSLIMALTAEYYFVVTYTYQYIVDS